MKRSALVLAAACGLTDGGGPTRLAGDDSRAELVEWVRDTSDRPVPGSLVAVVPPQPGVDESTTEPFALVVAGADGAFRAPRSFAGPVRLSATAPGYEGAFLLADAQGSDPTIVLRLPVARATLSGRVRWALNGEPVAARLRAHRYSDDAGAVFYTTADANGAFSLGVPPGTYRLLAIAEGAVAGSIEVDANRDSHVDFDLLTSGPVPSAVVEWIKSALRPLATTEPGSADGDLVRLASLFRDTRIIGVGEPTHGSREPIRLWHRLFEYLAREEAFTILACECSFVGGQAADLYVQEGTGSARAALHALRAFKSQEVLDLIESVRRANLSRHGRTRLHLAGIDLNPPAAATRGALDALARADRQASPRLREDLAVLIDDRTQFDIPNLSDERKAVVRDAARRLRLILEAREKERADPQGEDWGLAAQYARNVVHNVEMQLAPDLATSVAARDQAMAENVAWLLERHGARSRLLLVAHNEHIAVRDGVLGRVLRNRWDRGYRAVGFVFDRGGFRATEYAFGRGGTYRTFEVGPTPEGGLGNALARAGTSIGIVDLRALPAEGPVRDWFRYGRAAWSIGAGFFPRFAPAFLTPVVAPEAYDALVFGERITPTTALP